MRGVTCARSVPLDGCYRTARGPGVTAGPGEPTR
ncbi:hypothetical protein SFUMM280S_07354 [Streptomyces fumanus]